MGMFDFLKKKNQKTEKEVFFENLNLQLFPNGSKQIKSEAISIYNSCRNIDMPLDEFASLYKYSCGLYMITNDKSDSRMLDSIIRKSNNKIDYDNADILLFSVRKKCMKVSLNEKYSDLLEVILNAERELSSNTNKNFTFKDNGNWGLVPENPITVDGLLAIYVYLRRLSITGDILNIKYERVTSVEIEGFDGVIDEFEVWGTNQQKRKLYISGYGIEMPNEAPEGFVID